MHRADEVAALRALAPDFVPAVVLADVGETTDGRLADEVASWGAELAIAPLKAAGQIDRHDHALLTREYARVFDKVLQSGAPASR